MDIELEVNEVYELDGILLRCTKFSDTKIGTFQIVDENLKDVVIYEENAPGVIKDFGVRIIKNRLAQLKKLDLTTYKNKQLTLF